MPLPGSFAPSWSSDGSRVAFASEDIDYDDMQDDADIYIATADGTSMVRLTEDPYHNVAPTWIYLPAPVDSFISVSAAYAYSCGVRASGMVECWGDNSLGLDFVPKSERSKDAAFTRVSVGRWHSCGLRADGTAQCWGSVTYGESNVPAGVFTAVTVGDGYFHVCCILVVSSSVGGTTMPVS